MATIDDKAIEGLGDLGTTGKINGLGALVDMVGAGEQTHVMGDGDVDPMAALNEQLGKTPEVKTKKTKKVLTPDEQAKALVIKTARTKVQDTSQKLISGTTGQLAKIFTKFSRICGYLTDNDAKIDFSLVSKTSKPAEGAQSTGVVATEYTLKLTNFAPTAPRIFVIKVPAAVKLAIGNESKDEALPSKYTENPGAYELNYVTREELQEYMLRYSIGVLYEAAEIFVPFNKKSGNSLTSCATYDNCKQLPDLGMEYKYPALLRRGTYSKDGIAKISVKHSFRARLAAPGNYIPKYKFQTIQIPDALSTEEAANLTALYLARFASPKNKDTNMSRLTCLNADQLKHFNVVKDGNGYSIASNDVFTANKSISIFGSFEVAHWYDKTAEGNPRLLTPAEILLAKKYNKAESKQPIYLKNEIQPETSTDEGAYKFDPDCNVAKAAGGLLKFHEIQFSMLKKSTTNSNAKPTQQTAGFGGIGLYGIKESELQAILNDSKS